MKRSPSAAEEEEEEVCDNDKKRTKGQLTATLRQEKKPDLEVRVGGQATNHFLFVVLRVTPPPPRGTQIC